MKVTREELLNLRLEGLSYKEIGLIAGVSRQRVQAVLGSRQNKCRAVVEDAKGKCAICRRHVGMSGHVHHKNPLQGSDYYDYNDLLNLQFLCTGCHRMVHSPNPRPISQVRELNKP